MVDIKDPSIFIYIKKGDEKAFSLLFEGYYAGLSFFAMKYLNDLDLGRSLVQQVFIDLWQNRQKIEVKKSVKSYLFQTVRNRCIDYLRKAKTVVEVSELHADMEEVPFHDLVEEAELNERINSAVSQLPEKCREVFLLCRFEGLKYAEIARELNISIKTVEMQMGIALKKLRENLSDYQMINLMACFFTTNN